MASLPQTVQRPTLPPPMPTTADSAGSRGALTGAASRSYNVARGWEEAAVLSEQQQLALDGISEHCAQRHLPDHLLQEGITTVQSTAGVGSATAMGTTDGARVQGASLEDAVLQSSHHFHQWHSELEAARKAETEEKYRRYAATLEGHLSACQHILTKVEQTLAQFEHLKQQHHEVASKTRQLHDNCERLVGEKERLVEVADALRGKLAYFDELEHVAAQFHGAALDVDSDRFLPLLQRLDDCISYMASHPQYADAPPYIGKFRALQQRAMGSMRSRVQSVLRKAIEQVLVAIRDSKGAAISAPPAVNGNAIGLGARMAGFRTRSGIATAPLPPLAEGAEAALLYVRFRAAAEPGLKGLLQGIEVRSQRPEYARLLAECQAQYCEARLGLVAPVVRQRVAAFAIQPLPSLTRTGCAYLMQVCQMEHQLFEHFFPASVAAGAPGLEGLMDPLCQVLYDVLRPAFITLQPLEELCELVDILKHEVLEEQLGRRGEAVAPLRPTLARALADVQERVTFRAQTFIREEVAGYQPKPDDLDYPARLERLATAALSESPHTSAADLVEGDTSDANKESNMNAYKAWYPPVQQTLLCLGRTYRCVDSRIFGGLAQEAVACATAAAQSASRLVAKRSGPMDGQLFLIKQLLILREQIAPFQADFAVTEKELDFSHMRDHMRRIVAGQSSLFSFGADNAVVQLVSRGAPRVLESQVDSKKELEKALKATCEAFIMGATKATVEDMLSFITKVTAVKVVSASANAKPLREQAFASPQRLAEMVAKVRAALVGALPELVAKMKLYLNNPATHSVLFKPIKSNIAEAHGQIAALLDSEYTPEEGAAAGLTPPGDLAKLLDALC